MSFDELLTQVRKPDNSSNNKRNQAKTPTLSLQTSLVSAATGSSQQQPSPRTQYQLNSPRGGGGGSGSSDTTNHATKHKEINKKKQKKNKKKSQPPTQPLPPPIPPPMPAAVPPVLVGSGIPLPPVPVVVPPCSVVPLCTTPPLLPPIAEEKKGKKCLVLDLDETLVHSVFHPIECDFQIPVDIEGTIRTIYVSKRPHVDEFLKVCGELFEVVVFTASLAKYADPLLDLLDVHKVISHRLFRESCTIHYGTYVKDLFRMGRPLNSILIIDNSPHSYALNPQNALPCESWFDDKNDKELLDLLIILNRIADASVIDVRTELLVLAGVPLLETTQLPGFEGGRGGAGESGGGTGSGNGESVNESEDEVGGSGESESDGEDSDRKEKDKN